MPDLPRERGPADEPSVRPSALQDRLEELRQRLERLPPGHPSAPDHEPQPGDMAAEALFSAQKYPGADHQPGGAESAGPEIDDPAADDPAAGERAAGDPVASDPASDYPAYGDPAYGNPPSGDPEAGDVDGGPALGPGEPGGGPAGQRGAADQRWPAGGYLGYPPFGRDLGLVGWREPYRPWFTGSDWVQPWFTGGF